MCSRLPRGVFADMLAGFQMMIFMRWEELMSEYVLLHDNPIEEDRLGMLSALLDPYMRFRLDMLGLSEGWSCLEVGAGNGSMSRWMKSRVGPSGRVVCTDLETSFIDPLAGEGIIVRQFDAVRDPLPAAREGAKGFDLILARNVLHHVPERNDVIDRLIGALAPGGLLVTMEPDIAPMWTCKAPEWVSYWQAFCAWSEGRDIDYKLGRSLALRLARAGLDGVESYGETAMFRGGAGTPTPAATGFYRDTALAIGPRMIADGFLSQTQLDAFVALLDVPTFRAAGYHFTMAWGRNTGGRGRMAADVSSSSAMSSA